MTRHLIAARVRPVALPLLAALALTGCKLDSGNNDRSGDGDKTTVTPPPPPGGNRAPTISGTPPATAKVETLYDFTPQATDPDGDTLRYEIQARPSWATFNPNTGRLYGTPTAAGTFSDITISVTDGKARVSLPAFSITASEEAAGTGYAKLSWSAPMTNTDGSPLTDLAGFRVYYGMMPDAPSERLEIADPAARSTLIQGLTSGTWYFSISAYTARGVESARTPPASKTI